MRRSYGWTKTLWRRKSCRFLAAAVCAAVVGVAAGRAALHTVLRSVAIVDGNSMAPTFDPGSFLYTAPVSGPLNRGDIVVVDDGHKDKAIKRIIALPGETVHLWRGHVFINRQLLREPYLAKNTYTHPDPKTGTCTFKLGEEQFLVMGDNRLCSQDSRAYGPVERLQIQSRIQMPSNDLKAFFAPYTLHISARSSEPAS
jgi:signal peptidase I